MIAEYYVYVNYSTAENPQFICKAMLADRKAAEDLLDAYLQSVHGNNWKLSDTAASLSQRVFKNGGNGCAVAGYIRRRKV